MTPQSMLFPPAPETPTVPVTLYVVQAPPRELGVTPAISQLFSTVEALLPKPYTALLEDLTVLAMAQFNAQGQVTHLHAYRCHAGAEPLPSDVQPVGDWMHHHKLWFRKQTTALRNSLKYEALISYLDEYRPVLNVDLTRPLFSLALSLTS